MKSTIRWWLCVLAEFPSANLGGHPKRAYAERKVCCISLNFPPSSIASVHRVRHLARHLPTHGWRPTVVCLHEQYLQEPLDWELAKLVPKDIAVRKIRGFPLKWSRPFGITDLGLRTYGYLRREIKGLIERGDYQAVLITGWPFYQMLLGRFIKRRFRTPIVLDFQDPWVSAWGAKQLALSKAGLTHRLATVLEPRALRAADFITSVSDTQNAEMAARYPWLDVHRMAGIPIGGDPDDFNALRSSTRFDDINLEPGSIHLVYVGAFLPRAAAPVRTLFRAYAHLRVSNPKLAARIRLDFVGTSNQPHEGAPFSVCPIAEEEQVVEVVREIPQRLPYLRALSVLARSNGILLIGSDEPHYTASKIYPALMSGRPYLSLFHRASSAHSILSEAGGGSAFAFETEADLSGLVPQLAQALETIALNPKSLGTADPAAYAPYLAVNIAGRFATIFETVVADAGSENFHR